VAPAAVAAGIAFVAGPGTRATDGGAAADQRRSPLATGATEASGGVALTSRKHSRHAPRVAGNSAQELAVGPPGAGRADEKQAGPVEAFVVGGARKSAGGARDFRGQKRRGVTVAGGHDDEIGVVARAVSELNRG